MDKLTIAEADYDACAEYEVCAEKEEGKRRTISHSTSKDFRKYVRGVSNYVVLQYNF